MVSGSRPESCVNAVGSTGTCGGRRRRAATTPDEVDPALARVARQRRRHLLRRFVVSAERVGETGVRVAGDRQGSGALQIFEKGSHLLGPERAVQSGRDQRNVRDRQPRRLERLPRQRAPTRVRDRQRRDDGHGRAALREERLDREQGGFQIQGVERRLRQQEIDAPVQQAPRLLLVRRDELVERDRAERGVLDVRRQRRRAVGRPQRSRDEARLRGVRRRRSARRSHRELRCGLVHLVRHTLEAVVGERDRLRVERVGLDDIGAGVQVLAVDLVDDRGTREREQVVAALELARMVREPGPPEFLLAEPVGLNHRPHRPVEDEDPLAEQAVQGFQGVRHGQNELRSKSIKRARGRRIPAVGATSRPPARSRARSPSGCSSFRSWRPRGWA
jgi:hypothetical protein